MPSIIDKVAPVLRVVQFPASLIGLVLWAVCLSRLNSSSGSALHAVLGIFIAGTLWAVAGAGQYAWKRRNLSGNKQRWGIIVGLAIAVAVLDFCFLVLFATAAGLTGPSSSAARGNGVCYSVEDDDNDNGARNTNPRACGEVKGVFALSILNILTHAGSSIMHTMQSMQRPPNPKNLAQNPLKG